MYLLYTLLKYLASFNLLVKRSKKSHVESKFNDYQSKVDDAMKIEETDTQEKARKTYLLGSNVGLRDVYYRKYVESLENLDNSHKFSERIHGYKGRIIPYLSGAIDLYLINLLMQFEELSLVNFITTTYGYLK